MTDNKTNTAHDLVRAADTRHGKGTLMACDQEPERTPVIPPGCLSLAEALGCGGYPRGRIIDLFGPEGSGKTTLALHAVAECQKLGGLAAFVDAEHALDIRYAASLGVAPERMLVSQPDHGEQALEIVENPRALRRRRSRRRRLRGRAGPPRRTRR